MAKPSDKTAELPESTAEEVDEIYLQHPSGKISNFSIYT